MAKVSINPCILKWARKDTNLSVSEVAHKMGKNKELILLWENGTKKPTYIQLEKLAYNIFKKPIAIFFFPEAPDIENPKKEFRTLPEYEYEKLPYNVIRLFRKAQAMQLNIQELCNGNNPSENFIIDHISLSAKKNIESQVKMVRKHLGIKIEDQINWKSTTEALKKWRQAFDDSGVFVFKDAFRYDMLSGFCLYNDNFPLIYINNSMPKTRQIFTLFHELGHLLFKIGGIDIINDTFVDKLQNNKKQIEIFCNEFAGSLLVPDNDFRKKINKVNINDELVYNLANRYSVSREVILRKLFDRNKISQEYYQKRSAKWKKEAKEDRKDSNGGNYYRNQIVYLGQNYLDLVLEKYYQKKISDTQVADYLNTKVEYIPTLESYYM